MNTEKIESFTSESYELEIVKVCDAHAAGSERQAVFVLLIRVQHAQCDGQLPFPVCYDWERQHAVPRFITVISKDVLIRRRSKAFLQFETSL